jgi:hypothetical protein
MSTQRCIIFLVTYCWIQIMFWIKCISPRAGYESDVFHIKISAVCLYKVDACIHWQHTVTFILNGQIPQFKFGDWPKLDHNTFAWTRLVNKQHHFKILKFLLGPFLLNTKRLIFHHLSSKCFTIWWTRSTRLSKGVNWMLLYCKVHYLNGPCHAISIFVYNITRMTMFFQYLTSVIMDWSSLQIEFQTTSRLVLFPFKL